VHKLAQQCLAEPHFVLKPDLGDKQMISMKMRRAKLEAVRPAPPTSVRRARASAERDARPGVTLGRPPRR
jgi:hypothetical protein